jgi:Spy/CpxP family protein refolding chaperone
MNKIFTLVVSAVCLILLTTAPAVPGQTAEKLANAEAVAKQLNLTPQQEAKVLPILKEEGPKVEQIKNNPSLSGIQKMKELRAIHSQTAPQLQQILSPEQYQKLQAIREQRIKEAMAAKGAGH